MERWQDEYREVARVMANGSTTEKREIYDWLILKVVNGETLNFGYRMILESLHKELSK